VKVTGALTTSGPLVAPEATVGGIAFGGHTHGGVEPGGATTGPLE